MSKRKPLDETIAAFRDAERRAAAAPAQGPGRAARARRSSAGARRLPLRAPRPADRDDHRGPAHRRATSDARRRRRLPRAEPLGGPRAAPVRGDGARRPDRDQRQRADERGRPRRRQRPARPGRSPTATRRARASPRSRPTSRADRRDRAARRPGLRAELAAGARRRREELSWDNDEGADSRRALLAAVG